MLLHLCWKILYVNFTCSKSNSMIVQSESTSFCWLEDGFLLMCHTFTMTSLRWENWVTAIWVVFQLYRSYTQPPSLTFAATSQLFCDIFECIPYFPPQPFLCSFLLFQHTPNAHSETVINPLFWTEWMQFKLLCYRYCIKVSAWRLPSLLKMKPVQGEVIYASQLSSSQFQHMPHFTSSCITHLP